MATLLSKITTLIPTKLKKFFGITESYEGGFITDTPYSSAFGPGTSFRNFLGFFAFVDRVMRTRGGNAQEYRTDEQTLIIARALEKYNPIAQGLLTALRGYSLGNKGMTVEAVSRPNADPKLGFQARDFLDQFRDLNEWQCDLQPREPEAYNRAIRDGETLLRFYEDRIPYVRFVEPEFILPLNGSAEWTFGLEHAPGDVETILNYNVCYGGIYADNEIVPAEEIVHLKRNVDRCIKRGVSDFASTAEMVDQAMIAYRNFLKSEAVRQSYTYIAQHAEATAEDIDAFIAAQADYKTTSGASSGGLKDYALQFKNGVGVEHLPSGMVLSSLPSKEGLVASMAGINSALLAAGARYHFPLFLITGDQSQNNVADLGAAHPFMAVTVKNEQAWFSRFQREVMWRAVKIGVDTGELSEGVLHAVDIKITPQDTLPREPKDATDRNKTLHDEGLLSKRSWAAAEGLDYDTEQELRTKEAPVTISITPPAAGVPQNRIAPAPNANGNGSYIAN